MIYGFGLYGMGGYLTDPGELTFSHKVQALGVNILKSPYRDTDINIITEVIKDLPKDSKVILWGSSLGANNLPYIATLAKREIEGIWGFQASLYGMRYPIPANVKFAHEVFNSNVVETGGLGAYKWTKAPGNKVTNLYLSDRHDMHPGETEASQEMFLNEMKRVIHATN
jgi:hypothetical protein